MRQLQPGQLWPLAFIAPLRWPRGIGLPRAHVSGRTLTHGFLLLLTLVSVSYLWVTRANLLPSQPYPVAVSSSLAASDLAWQGSYLLRPAPLVGARTQFEAGNWIEGWQIDQWPEQERGASQEARPEARQEVGQEANQQPREVITYEVARGDSLSTIAERFGISVETVAWANDIVNPDFLRLGQKLLILPISGILHVVQQGETLSSIAQRYGRGPSEILAYAPNGISQPNMLPAGKKLIIPGGEAPRPTLSTRGGLRQQAASPPVQAQAIPATAGRFAWPTPGNITQYYSAGHPGLDIGAPHGNPVRAAAGGVVVEAQRLGWGYGWYLIIDHGDGYSTLYAHMSRFDVWTGEQVVPGQLIGAVGSTGWSTGPHLHFEVLKNGSPFNPLSVLP